MVDEAMADLRTLLGTDVGLRRYLHYVRTNKEAKQIFEQIGYLRVLGATVRALPRFLRASVDSLRGRRRWPWHPPERYLGKPLGSLRATYRILVI